jgi:hypothetical protein
MYWFFIRLDNLRMSFESASYASYASCASYTSYTSYASYVSYASYASNLSNTSYASYTSYASLTFGWMQAQVRQIECKLSNLAYLAMVG